MHGKTEKESEKSISPYVLANRTVKGLLIYASRIESLCIWSRPFQISPAYQYCSNISPRPFPIHDLLISNLSTTLADHWTNVFLLEFPMASRVRGPRELHSQKKLRKAVSATQMNPNVRKDLQRKIVRGTLSAGIKW